MKNDDGSGRDPKYSLPIGKIVRLYTVDMLSETAIAKIYHVPNCVIANRLVNAGVRRRGQSEAEKLKWDRMTVEQRAHQVAAAHAKARGRKVGHPELIRRAVLRGRRFKLSPLERIFMDAFDDAGIVTVPQFAFDIFNVDFAIPSRKIAIEIDGGNWHQSPRKRKQDARKEAALRSAGWTIIRFKSKDLASAVESVRADPAFRG